MDVICGCKKIKKKKQKKDENKKELPKDSIGESLASTWIENRRAPYTELPKDSVAILESSFNIDNPYPSKEQKEALALESGLSYNQVDGWFVRQRKKEGVAGSWLPVKKQNKKQKKNTVDAAVPRKCSVPNCNKFVLPVARLRHCLTHRHLDE